MKLYEYRIEKDLDLLNVVETAGETRCSGVERLNQLAKERWKPYMILEWGAIGFKVRMLLRRKKLSRP